jgi:hypothetical protein
VLLSCSSATVNWDTYISFKFIPFSPTSSLNRYSEAEYYSLYLIILIFWQIGLSSSSYEFVILIIFLFLGESKHSYFYIFDSLKFWPISFIDVVKLSRFYFLA